MRKEKSKEKKSENKEEDKSKISNHHQSFHWWPKGGENLAPSRGNLPVLEHMMDGHVPLILEAGGQLADLFGGGLGGAPHLGPGRFGRGVGRDEVAGLGKID